MFSSVALEFEHNRVRALANSMAQILHRASKQYLCITVIRYYNKSLNVQPFNVNMFKEDMSNQLLQNDVPLHEHKPRNIIYHLINNCLLHARRGHTQTLWQLFFQI